MLLQTQSTSTRPITTAHLAQTMTLLGLTALELRERIENELATNPALELIDDRYCPTCQRPLAYAGPCPICSRPQGNQLEEPIVFVSPREDFNYSGSSLSTSENPYDEYTAEQDDLSTYVLQQIAPELSPEDYHLAIHILTCLDEDGLLSVPLAEIASFQHVPIARVEKVIDLIQHADPIGVGSSTPQGALQIQLEVLSESSHVPPLASRVIQEGMELLSRNQYHELAKIFNVSTSTIKEIAQYISSNLNPFPARAFWGNNHQTTPKAEEVYYHPDIIISKLNEEENPPLIIEVISPLVGKLRVNPLFREAIHNAPKQKSEQWQADIERASLLVKCIQQRNHTIVRLMQKIAGLQKSFILKGDAFLLPFTRASMARELNVHESTISRAVSSKTVQLPNGRIIPMGKFFDRSLHIRTELIKIITQENKPLTDTEIADILKKRGYSIARRTVAKYRAIEGIMPAHLRAKFHTQSSRSNPILAHTS